MSTQPDQSENNGRQPPKMSTKRKHKTLTLKEKLQVIKLIENGKTLLEVAKRYGIGKSTVSEIKKNKLKLLEFTASFEKKVIAKKRNLRISAYPEVEALLYEWFLQEKAKGTPLNGEIIRRKARSIHNQMTQKGRFMASYGWLQNFKERYGIQWSSSEPKSLPTELPTTDANDLNDAVKTEPCGDGDEFQEIEGKIIKEEHGDEPVTESVSQEEATSAFDTCIRWALENHLPLQQIISLQEMRHQVTLTDRLIKVEPIDY